MDLFDFGITQLMKFLLVLARVAGIFTTAPVFGNVHITPLARVAIALSFAFVFFPMAVSDSIPCDILAFISAIVREAALGLAMGFLVAVAFAAIQMAGAYVDLQVGFGFSQVVDPTNREHNAVIGQLQNLAATLVFLAVNGHHVVIRGLADSFAIVPLGQMGFRGAAMGGLIHAFAAMFLAALKIGAPIVGAIFLTDVALGILARTVPQLNVFVVGFPAKLGVALFAVLASLPMALAVITGLFLGLHKDFVLLLRTLSG